LFRHGLNGWRRAVTIKDCHDRINFNGVAFLEANFRQRSGGGRRDLSVNLVRRDLKQRFVAFDSLADFLQPLCYRPLRDGLTHLRHHHFSAHNLCSSVQSVAQ